MGETRFLPALGLLLGGMIVWAASFAAAYGMAATVCARGLGDETVLGIALLPFSLGIITLAALVATGLIALAAYRRPAGTDAEPRLFLRSTAHLVALLALVGILWNGLPALLFATCA
jgi:hypothetical protein